MIFFAETNVQLQLVKMQNEVKYKSLTEEIGQNSFSLNRSCDRKVCDQHKIYNVAQDNKAF